MTDAGRTAPTGFAALADVSDEEEEEEGSEHEEEKEADDNDPSYFTAHKVSRARQQHTFGTMPNCKISRPIMLGLNSLGLEQPTRIQTECIPVAMAGLDIVASSQTGSGKTVAFWVGILERLQHRNRKQANTRVVVLTPTRELAVQVHSVGVALARYTDISFCLCVGGLSLKAQEQELKRRPDVVVSTPGRLIDHVRNTPCFTMDSVEILVLDEADRMLEEGFHDELEEIIQSAPHSRQTLLFSATVTESISKLSRLSMNKPVRIKVDDMTKVAEGLTQEFVRVRGDQPGESIERNSRSGERNREALLVTLCATTFARKGRTIIFFRSKAQAHRMKVVFSLYERGLERSDELHGDLTQEMRLQSLKRFRDGESAFLMATDLASRGLDIKGIETVINYEMPRSIEIYMHRVGRTARAGARGRAITLVGETDRKLVKLAVKHASAASKKKGTKRNEVEQRVVGPSETKETSAKLKALEREVRGVFEAEREEKELRRTEMELQKGENLLLHEEEIKSRPARSWFQSGADKAAAKQAGKVEHNAKFLEKEKKAAAAQKAARKPVNRKERRKREMAEADAEDTGKGSSKGAMAASIRSAKKAARPTKITHMSERSDKPKANSGKRKKNKSSFGSEMGVSGGGAQSTGAPSPKKRKVEHKKGGKPNKRR